MATGLSTGTATVTASGLATGTAKGTATGLEEGFHYVRKLGEVLLGDLLSNCLEQFRYIFSQVLYFL
jgi:hypothetical protein